MTLRRLTAFRPVKGARVTWSFGERTGEATANPLVSIPGLAVVRVPRRLTVALSD